LLLFYFSFSLGAPSTCEDFGFNQPGCSLCDDLKDYVSTTEISRKCKECCFEDRQEITDKYNSALLKICRWKLGAFPQINTFIEEETRDQKYSNLKVSFVSGQYPVLEVSKDKGETIEVMPIDKWKLDEIREFLSTRLEIAAA